MVIDAGDTLDFDAFNPDDVLALSPFDYIEFDDGSTLSYDDLMAKGFDIEGTAGIDGIDGTLLERKRINTKRILTLHRAGCYRSSYRFPAANTEWRIAA